jgi:hypothetical protein
VGDQCLLNLGTLAPGAEGTATLTVDVGASVPQFLRRLDALVRIRGNADGPVDPTPRDNFDFESTTLLRRVPDLRLSMDDGGVEVAEGGTLVYDVTYSNTGPVDATGVEIRLRPPRGSQLRPADSQGQWTCGDADDGGPCTLAVGNLAAGQTGTAKLAVTLGTDTRQLLGEVFAVGRINDDGANGRDPTPWNNVALEQTRLSNFDRSWARLVERFSHRLHRFPAEVDAVLAQLDDRW